MSSLLDQAFVDAKALKEAALKNAESTIVDKYSEEVKETLNKMLEQDEFALPGADPMADPLADPMADPLAAEAPLPEGDVAEDVPLGVSEGEKLCGCPDEGEESKITIKFDELAEALQKLEEEIDPESIEEEAEPDQLEEEEDLDEEIDLSALVSAVMEDLDLDESEEELEEDSSAEKAEAESIEFEASGEGGYANESLTADSLIDDIMEKLRVDMGADLSGWAGRRPEDKVYEIEKVLAARRSTSLEQDSTLGRGMADRTDTDPQKELEDLKQAQEELVFENNQLKEKLQDYENVVEQLKESVTDVNLSNARLLYTIRVLRNTSLYELQKDKIGDAISKAGSVPEAKTIFETLQSTVESTPKRAPQSLSETINRRSSILRASSRKETVNADPLADRLKKLAGIN